LAFPSGSLGRRRCSGGGGKRGRGCKTAQAAAAHAALFCFTLLLALRVDGRTTYSWWYAL
jgi:hypothetical protein